MLYHNVLRYCMCNNEELQLPSEFPQGKQKGKVTLLGIHLSLGKMRVTTL